MSDWILAKKKLPPLDIDVLVYWINHHTGMAYYDVAYLGGPGWNSITQKQHLELVAWMPLPEPPKEGTD